MIPLGQSMKHKRYGDIKCISGNMYKGYRGSFNGTSVSIIDIIWICSCDDEAEATTDDQNPTSCCHMPSGVAATCPVATCGGRNNLVGQELNAAYLAGGL